MRDEAFILSNVLVSSSSSATQSNPSPGQARRPGMKAAARSITDLPDPAFAARQAKALLVHARLCTEYGAPFPFFSTKDPLASECSALAPHQKRRLAPRLPEAARHAAHLGSRARRAHPSRAARHPGLHLAPTKGSAHSDSTARNQPALRHRCTLRPRFSGRNSCG